MTRSRLVVIASMVVVVLGALAGLGALWLNPLRAAVGPLPGEALVLPADTRYVLGLDVRRFVASPFYARYATRPGMQPGALAELEQKTGLNPARDLDQIVVAGSGSGREAPTLALITGRFDLHKLGRSLETEGKARGYNHDGVTVYAFKEAAPRTTALALLDGGSLLYGSKDRVEAAVSSRTRGEAPLKGNATLLRLVEKVRPGSTLWMVGDQSVLAGLPTAMPAPGGGEGAMLTLPALRALSVTGDLDPQVSLAITGETADEAAARSVADVVRGLVGLVSLQAAQKPELQQVASAVSVATEANHVLVTVLLPYALLDALQAGAAGPAPKLAAPVR